MKRLALLIALLMLGTVAGSASASTHYVRTDGGTATQCTGLVNAAYPGSGSSQPCAVNHPFWLLDQSTFAWLIAPGDTVKFEDAGPYYIGLGPLNGLGQDWPFCHGQPNACNLPPMLANTSILGVGAGSCHNSQHKALVNPTKFIGINQSFTAFFMEGSVGVDLECFDISQPDICTRSGVNVPAGTISAGSLTSNILSVTYSQFGGTNALAIGNLQQLSGFSGGAAFLNGQWVTVLSSGFSGSTFQAAVTHADVGSVGTGTFTIQCIPGMNNYFYQSGLVLSYLAGNDGPSDSTVRDLAIHGLANEAVTGGKMNQHGTTNTMTFSDIYMYGNANTGWNGDAGGCTTNCESTGTINLSYISAYWSGCMEVKPNSGTIGGNGVGLCVDQGYGGNGDNIVMIATGGTWNWNHVICRWGMQDCIDLLHTGDDIASGVTINMNDVDAEGSEGQQWKVGGTTTGTNMRLITNCERSQFPFAPNPSNYAQYASLPCRAFAGVTLSVSPGHTITISNSTIAGYGNPQIDIDCYDQTAGTHCPDNTYSVVLKNNLLWGTPNPVTTTVPGGIFWGAELNDPFGQAGSAIINNLWAPNTMRASSGGGPSTGCPQDPAFEASYVCGDPKMIGQTTADLTTLDNFNINLQPGSAAIGAGVNNGVTPDFNGNARTAPFTIGAVNLLGAAGATVFSGAGVVSGTVTY